MLFSGISIMKCTFNVCQNWKPTSQFFSHLLLQLAGRPFAELFPRPYRLWLPSADEHDCHKTALDENAGPRRKGYLSESLVSSGDTAQIVQTQFAEDGQPEPG